MSCRLSFLRPSPDCIFKPQRRCLHYLKYRRRTGDGYAGRVLAARRYAATAAVRVAERSAEQRAEYIDDEGPDDSTSPRRRDPASILYPKPRPKADPKPLVDQLRHLFPPLDFPDTVATQMLTHISANEAWAGHNARLAFVGRRVLQSYLLLFLQDASEKLARTTSPPIDVEKTFNFDHIAYKALHTHLLGEYVGAQWELARTMLWMPPVRSEARKRGNAPGLEGGHFKSPGLYKVQGTTVEGIMGGIFHQFGGSIAQRVFHTRLLPHILCPGTPFGLHDAFHPAALELQSRMGGPNGLLMSPGSSERRNSESRPRQKAASADEKATSWITRSPSDRTETSREHIALQSH